MSSDTVNLERLYSIAEKPSVDPIEFVPPEHLDECIKFLRSSAAFESLRLDPYWPKWNTVWWRMLLLWELGLVEQIPLETIEAMVSAMNSHYISFFPVIEAEIPEGVDGYRNIMCHCGLGSMYQVLSAAKVNVDVRIPWMRPWFLKYQLPDGGLNCDESAYTKTKPKSSIVSSFPPLESILSCMDSGFTDDEINFLDRGAQYLFERKLHRSASTGAVIEPTWMQLTFPRFYQYDVLRGLSFLLKWSVRLQKPISIDCIFEVVREIDSKFPDGTVSIERSIWRGESSRVFDEQTKEWSKGDSQSFSLLNAVSETGMVSPCLIKSWNEAKKNLQSALKQNLIV